MLSCSSPVTKANVPDPTATAVAVEAKNFRYMPFEQGAVEENQILNTAGISTIYLKERITDLVANSLAGQLSARGYDVDDSADYVIRGSIDKFLVENLLTGLQFSLVIRFEILAEGGETVYSNDFQSNTKKARSPGIYDRTAKEIVRTSIERFMKDARRKGVLL
jgi:hypothetical protein